MESLRESLYVKYTYCIKHRIIMYYTHSSLGLFPPGMNGSLIMTTDCSVLSLKKTKRSSFSLLLTIYGDNIRKTVHGNHAFN